VTDRTLVIAGDSTSSFVLHDGIGLETCKSVSTNRGGLRSNSIPAPECGLSTLQFVLPTALALLARPLLVLKKYGYCYLRCFLADLVCRYHFKAENKLFQWLVGIERISMEGYRLFPITWNAHIRTIRAIRPPDGDVAPNHENRINDPVTVVAKINFGGNDRRRALSAPTCLVQVIERNDELSNQRKPSKDGHGGDAIPDGHVSGLTI
jgi:hypothetical protein